MPQFSIERHTVSGGCEQKLGMIAAQLPESETRLLRQLLAGEQLAKRQRKLSRRPGHEVDRVRLIASFLRLCSQDDPSSELGERLTNRLCEDLIRTGCPSQELIGTFLAALSLSPKDEPGVRPRIRRTMLAVLRACVDLLTDKCDPAPVI